MNKAAPQKMAGRDISSLMSKGPRGSEAGSALPHGGVQQLPIDKISPNALQPRRHFDDALLAELAESIREHGVLQPVIVTRMGAGYQLVVGERRWRASQLAGLTEIPVLVREFAEADGLAVALIENIQRQDLNALEEAAAYQFLMREHLLTQEEVAARVGKSRSAVANAVRLLNLPQPIQQDVEAGVISAGHARALLSLTRQAEQLKVWARVKSHHLSVRQTEAYVRQLQEGEKTSSSSKRRLPPEWIDVQENLQRHLSAQVKLRPRTRAAGKIEIHYSSPDELDRLIHTLTARQQGPTRRARLDDNLL
ncbi:MAG: ParB/RepB/Spo0J family partition protein [Proteobacteria bacterium]|nr:ParB/RepB/Spo0J family partition protein [Pseudomonadota bacterium]